MDIVRSPDHCPTHSPMSLPFSWQLPFGCKMPAPAEPKPNDLLTMESLDDEVNLFAQINNCNFDETLSLPEKYRNYASILVKLKFAKRWRVLLRLQHILQMRELKNCVNFVSHCTDFNNNNSDFIECGDAVLLERGRRVL